MSAPTELPTLVDGNYYARVLADSLSPDGVRLTTVEVCYPHPTHKDFTRHRADSRSAMSFRAMPPEKLAVMRSDEGCFVPEAFGQRVTGMGTGAALSPEAQERARGLWLHAKNVAWETCDALVELGVSKEHANIPTQDYCFIREIVTATDWDNKLALRTALKPDGSPMARPEVYKEACLIRDARAASTPQRLEYGQWHLPLVTAEELAQLCAMRRSTAALPDDYLLLDASTDELQEYERQLKMASARRCARVSFDRHTDGEDLEVSVAKAEELLYNGHLSPFEHQARPFRPSEWETVNGMRSMIDAAVGTGAISDQVAQWMSRQLDYCGNFRGWVQQRKSFAHEHRYDLVVAGRADVALT